jgi:CubicO group peptidase (beta-lactamase class C family)
VPTTDKVAITLRHLSLNSSGLPRTPPSLARATTENPFATYDENALYRDLVHTTLESAPGTRILYSELGVGLLGFVLGKKLGGYTQAVQNRILGPLGLHETSFSVPPADAARFAAGTNDDLVPVPHWQFDALVGAGGLISTAHDQLAFLDAELDAAAGGHNTLRPAMHLTQESQLEGDGANEGLGWNIDSAGRYWQVGGTGGFRSFIGFDPKTKRGVVLLASSSISLIDSLARRIYDVLAGQPVPVPKFPDPMQLSLFAGTYDFQGMKLAMKVVGKRIYVEGPGEPRIRMLPISDHEFWIESLQSVCVFEQEGGKVSRAVFVLGDRQMAAPRVE